MGPAAGKESVVNNKVTERKYFMEETVIIWVV